MILAAGYRQSVWPTSHHGLPIAGFSAHLFKPSQMPSAYQAAALNPEELLVELLLQRR